MYHKRMHKKCHYLSLITGNFSATSYSVGPLEYESPTETALTTVAEIPEQPAPSSPPSDCSCMNEAGWEQLRNCTAELGLHSQPVDEQIKWLFDALGFGVLCCTVSQRKVQSTTVSTEELKRHINHLSSNV